MRKKKFVILGILFCMVVCLLAPRLQAGGTCSETTTESTDATKEEILSEFDKTKGPFPGDNFYLGDVPSQIDSNLPQSGKKGPAAIGDLPDTFSNAKKPPMLNEDGEPSKYSDENGDWYWGTDGHLYPWPPPPTQPETDDGTASEADSVVDDLQPSVLSEKSPEDIADEAYEKWQKKAEIARKEADFARIMKDASESAAIRLKLALDDAMDAEPGSEEAREAAEKVKEAAKKAKEVAERAEKQMQKYEEAKEESGKAYQEYEEALDEKYEAEKAAQEEAEKQNKAAREAAEKAYEATGHGNKK